MQGCGGLFYAVKLSVSTRGQRSVHRAGAVLLAGHGGEIGHAHGAQVAFLAAAHGKRSGCRTPCRPPRACRGSSAAGLRGSCSRSSRCGRSISTRRPAASSFVAHLLARSRGARSRDRQHLHLHGREPQRERAGKMLGEDADKALDAAEHDAVDHDRAVLLRRPRRCIPAQTAPAAGSRAGWCRTARCVRCSPSDGSRASGRRTRRRPR